ncbi:MAG: NrfD/PsrC family molybdoenzyme membrane anchor subunit [Rhodoblastus sp.]|uniref:NrfD/PsrC family molybdoenzyme membrane anchor subunit n=1 Tax=Rhodoblastus sp. TaxID=1962975 RepID=UPI003F94D458
MSLAPASAPSRLLPLGATDRQITDAISAPLLGRKSWRRWWIAVAFTLPFLALTLAGLLSLAVEGVGTWGINTTNVWGFAIANYVWWIGIGNAGTLISSLLLLTRQDWRASINRFAEAMTLFSVSIAGIFPIIHLGRPQYFYWLAPYPNTMTLWPQWRSALVWDFWAILSYLLFSILFWFVGLIPDAAAIRDQAGPGFKRRFFGILALGWRGSAHHWTIHKTLQTTLAALAVPLVCSVHSIVGLDFAASLMPGWQETIFPPYFVVGAMYSGFAMVVILAALIRWGLDLQDYVTMRHFEAMALIMLMASLVMGASYATEWFTAWYGGEQAERSLVAFEFTGYYRWLFWLLLLFNVALPQILWSPRARRSLGLIALVAIGVNIGMWFERILILWNTLGHGFLPSMRHVFIPTLTDWSLLIGPLGAFAFLFLLFARTFPVVSIYEVRELALEQRSEPPMKGSP